MGALVEEIWDDVLDSQNWVTEDLENRCDQASAAWTKARLYVARDSTAHLGKVPPVAVPPQVSSSDEAIGCAASAGAWKVAPPRRVEQQRQKRSAEREAIELERQRRQQQRLIELDAMELLRRQEAIERYPELVREEERRSERTERENRQAPRVLPLLSVHWRHLQATRGDGTIPRTSWWATDLNEERLRPTYRKTQGREKGILDCAVCCSAPACNSAWVRDFAGGWRLGKTTAGAACCHAVAWGPGNERNCGRSARAPNSGPKICRDCTSRWIDAQLDTGTIELRCPGEGCRQVLEKADVVLHSTSAQLYRYNRLKSNQLREQATGQAAIGCPLSGVDREITAWMVNNTMQCPGCFQLVERSYGCNHIRCSCGTDFCYRCGENTTGSPYLHSCADSGRETATPFSRSIESRREAATALPLLHHIIDIFHEESWPRRPVVRAVVAAARSRRYVPDTVERFRKAYRGAVPAPITLADFIEPGSAIEAVVARADRRVDPVDGQAHPRASFLAYYGPIVGARRWRDAGRPGAKRSIKSDARCRWETGNFSGVDWDHHFPVSYLDATNTEVKAASMLSGLDTIWFEHGNNRRSNLSRFLYSEAFSRADKIAKAKAEADAEVEAATKEMAAKRAEDKENKCLGQAGEYDNFKSRGLARHSRSRSFYCDSKRGRKHRSRYGQLSYSKQGFAESHGQKEGVRRWNLAQQLVSRSPRSAKRNQLLAI